jgi:NAD(P)-dependent dehydrogenase (short-subunit alcohol dehydrogenase family)
MHHYLGGFVLLDRFRDGAPVRPDTASNDFADTAAKHAIVGLVRSFGQYLPSESIILNAVCPNVIRTNISTGAFYDTLEKDGILTPIEGVVETFEKLLDAGKGRSGEILEIGPKYGKDGEGAVPRKGAEYLDKESAEVFRRLGERGRPLHQPR